MTANRLKQIEMVLLDVDGVLTAGEIIYSDSGEQIKIFNVKDGIGIRLLKEAGIKVGIITGRKADALKHRCDNLGIELLFDGIRDKSKALDDIKAKTGIPFKAIAFVGDDLPDLPVMKKVGLAVAVGDANEMVKHHAHMTTRAQGGKGAVREISEAILKEQGLWDGIIDRLF
ncbi:MAG: HAD-IIIA family hydrolase [Desulfobacteraceae bacterium]|jgi:3-deoxy-D-manno-octulosonate 8-phosphate phosphatase (KDO 8-P phosphatase)